MTRSRSALTFALVLLAGLAACRAGGGGPTPGPSGPVAHPAGDAVILRVDTDGGFVPPGWLFTHVPQFSLLGDGRVIVPAAVPTIYPGPAMAPLLVRRLDESGVQAILLEALGTGLFTADRSFRGASGWIMDGSTSVFTLHAGGREVTVSVYALGLVDDASAGRLDPAERAAHRALSGLLGHLSGADTWLAGSWSDAAWQGYRPAALRLLTRLADADAPDPSGIESQLLPWPGSGDPATFGRPARAEGSRCGVVSGAEASAWLSALDSANALTRYTSAGHRYAVSVRPLLPDEPVACSAQD